MLNSQFVSSFSISSLAQALSAPYTSFSAYSSGLIDSKGNILKPEGNFNSFEYFVIKLKKIFEELPTSSTKIRLQNYSTAYQLFTENVQKFGINKDEYLFFIEGCLVANSLTEDMTTGSAPGTLGVPTQTNNIGGVQGFEPRLGEIPQTALDNLHMFDVSPEEFESFKKAKRWKDIAGTPTKKYLQRYQRKNINGKMALRGLDKNGKQQIHFINLKPLSLAEEYDLNFLLETKKQMITRTIDDDHLQFKNHIEELIKLHQNEKKLARKSEYEARLLNHIKNYNLVKTNPQHLKKYIDDTHQTILSSSSASSTDTHRASISSDGSLSLTPVDVKDISRGDSYVNIEIPKEELLSIPGLKDSMDTSGESKESRVDVTKRLSGTVKKFIDDFYTQNPEHEASNKPKKGSFMIKRSDGRFYFAGSEVLGDLAERKVRLSETGHQRRARKSGKENPHPNFKRISARKAFRVLDPVTKNTTISPFSISKDEYDTVKQLMGADQHKFYDDLIKPHLD